MKELIFIKIGGSYLTDKTKAYSLDENHIHLIAKAISVLLNENNFDIILAHGAGAYGHIKAKQFKAQSGIHPVHNWQAFYQIRHDMISMNAKFLQICYEEKLYPVTVQPSAIIMSKSGKIEAINSDIIQKLLAFDQIPLLHGDIVLDKNQGFTIASTENILTALCKTIFFHRVIMISDVSGVYDDNKNIIPEINSKNYNQIMKYLGSSKGIDITGGMKSKVEQLYELIKAKKILKSHILSVHDNYNDLKNLIFNNANLGTLIN